MENKTKISKSIYYMMVNKLWSDGKLHSTPRILLIWANGPQVYCANKSGPSYPPQISSSRIETRVHTPQRSNWKIFSYLPLMLKRPWRTKSWSTSDDKANSWRHMDLEHDEMVQNLAIFTKEKERERERRGRLLSTARTRNTDFVQIWVRS